MCPLPHRHFECVRWIHQTTVTTRGEGASRPHHLRACEEKQPMQRMPSIRRTQEAPWHLSLHDEDTWKDAVKCVDRADATFPSESSAHDHKQTAVLFSSHIRIIRGETLPEGYLQSFLLETLMSFAVLVLFLTSAWEPKPCGGVASVLDYSRALLSLNLFP